MMIITIQIPPHRSRRRKTNRIAAALGSALDIQGIGTGLHLYGGERGDWWWVWVGV
jgi:hypothetical protein